MYLIWQGQGLARKALSRFAGGLNIPEGQDYSITIGRLLILHGSADTVLTMNQFAQLTSDLNKHGVPHEMITYSWCSARFYCV